MNFIRTELLFDIETRQIIRYRATATLRRPHIKQFTASNEGGGGGGGGWRYKTNGNLVVKL